MSVSDLPQLLADSVLTDQEFGIGEILSGSCVMAALTGSLCVIAFWWTQYSRGISVMPMANRPLLHIPVPLLIPGLVIALMMAGFVLVNSPAADQLASSDLVERLRQAVIYNIAMILLLGMPVLLLNWRQWLTLNLRGIHKPPGDDPNSGVTGIVNDQNLCVVQSTVAISSSVDSDNDISHDDTPVEMWRWERELRFAAEICLVAWLPTAILKLTMALLLPEQDQHPFLEMIINGVGTESLFLIALTAVVLAPLMEELLYRVIILGGFLNHRSPIQMSAPFAIGVTSLLFAFAHGFPDSIALLPLAAAIGWTYYQRRSYRTVVLVHVLFNGFNIAIAGLTML
ncbi:MAG: CPBP family intramembrane metalloprotease [Fuerstiella sp.]|nr:CPBP family intramembrane metalloprotease [Fuerstiella sp.]